MKRRTLHRPLRAVLLVLVFCALVLALASCGSNHAIAIEAEYSSDGKPTYLSCGKDALRERLTVRALDMVGHWFEIEDYEIEGELAVGECTLTVRRGALRSSFTVNVEEATPVGIDVFYEQNATVYPSTPLDTLREDLDVAVVNSDGSRTSVSDYVLTGQLTAGECEITVTHAGFTGSFTVTVTEAVPVSLRADFFGGTVSHAATLENLKNYLAVLVVYSDGSERETLDYTLEGEIQLGTREITVTSGELTSKFVITVAELSEINGIKLEYSSEKHGYEVIEYVGSANEVIIPSEFGGLPVVSVGARAFYGCTSLAEIFIPASVKTVEEYAFYNCTELSLMTFESGSLLETVGRSAFALCRSLDNVDFGGVSSLKAIGKAAFYGCKALSAITLAASVEEIGTYAFEACTSLESITLESGSRLSSIGDHAFSGCSRLREVDICGGVLSSIGSYAFRSCTSLAGFTLPATVTALGEAVFHNCTNLSEIFVEAESESFAADGGVLYSADGKRLVSYPAGRAGSVFSVPEGVETLEAFAFAYSQRLETVMLHAGVGTVGKSAFEYSAALSEMDIPASVTELGGMAFYECKTLERVSFDSASELRVLKLSTFVGCTSLVEVTLPPSLTDVASYAFYGCSALSEITLPESVKIIGVEVFTNCESLSAVNFIGLSGWSIAEDAEGTGGQSVSVNDPSANAKNLKETYSTYYWLRKNT